MCEREKQREREKAREKEKEREKEKRRKRREREREKEIERTKQTAAHLTSVSYVGCFKGRVQPVDDDAGALLCRKFDSHVLRRHLLIIMSDMRSCFGRRILTRHIQKM